MPPWIIRVSKVVDMVMKIQMNTKKKGKTRSRDIKSAREVMLTLTESPGIW